MCECTGRSQQGASTSPIICWGETLPAVRSSSLLSRASSLAAGCSSQSQLGVTQPLRSGVRVQEESRDSHTQVHGGSIRGGQQVEASPTSVDQRVGKGNVACAHDEFLFSLKKERDSDPGDRMELEDGALGETHHGSTYRRGIRGSPGHGDRKYRACGQGLGAAGGRKGCGGRSPCAARGSCPGG